MIVRPVKVQASLAPVRFPVSLMLAFAVLGTTALWGNGVPAAVDCWKAESDLRRLCPDSGTRFVLRVDGADAKYEEGYHVVGDPVANTVTITGGSPFALRLGANFFCARVLGVRWFMPGPDGEYAPALPSGWRLPAIDFRGRPSFASRGLWGLTWRGDPAAADLWCARNGLHERWEHAHAQLHVIPWILYGSHPEYFPELEGARYCPTGPADYDWQPAFTQPGVVARSAGYVQSRLSEHPGLLSVSLSINDSIRFDQSSESLAARGPLRWFRGRPDYSDLVFGYMNRVADAAQTDRLLSAYAYYWCENVPTFRLRPNVLPWLTADRTQWYDPAFRAQDEALIRRWTESGAKAVGVYDYLYGAPYLIPRLTPHLIADAIHVERAAGVRGYFAECSAHWGFDAPKLWLASQLLQDADGSTDPLLDEFYSKYFGSAAEPMKAFYSGCENAWLRQPGTARWIKFYYDPDQATIFPRRLRASLWSRLREAAACAGGDAVVSRRIQLVVAAFRVTDLFCQWYEGAAPAGKVPQAFSRALTVGAMAPVELSAYLAVNAPGPATGRAGQWKTAPMRDVNWAGLKAPKSLDDVTFTWNAGPWLARGEPGEHRTIELRRLPDGGQAVRFTQVADEHLSQWCRASPSALYRATVQFQGRISPGNEVSLILAFVDAAGNYVGEVSESRLHPGIYDSPTLLHLLARAPPEAEQIGFVVYARHQSPWDMAEFSRPAIFVAQRR